MQSVSVGLAERGPAAHAIRPRSQAGQVPAEWLSALVPRATALGQSSRQRPKGRWRWVEVGAAAHRPEDELEVDREGEDASARPPHGLFGLVAWSTEIQLQVQRGRQMGVVDNQMEVQTSSSESVTLPTSPPAISKNPAGPKLRAVRALHRFARAATLAHQVNQSTI